MSAISKNNEDIIFWIHQIIDSCTYPEQLELIDNLIINFGKLLSRDIGQKETDEIIFGLKMKRNVKLKMIK